MRRSVQILLSLVTMVLLSSCISSTGTHWYAPTTWFSHAPAAAADKAHATADLAREKVITVQDDAVHGAHIEFAKTGIALSAIPSGKAADLARRTNANGLGLLDQVQPLTAAEAADLRNLVSDLLSENAATVKSAEARQAASEGQIASLSRELSETRAKADAAAQLVTSRDAELRKAFDEENDLANQLRASHWRFGFAIAGALLCAAAYCYLKFAVGGIPLAAGKFIRDLRIQHPDLADKATSIFDSYLNRHEQAAIAKNAT